MYCHGPNTRVQVVRAQAAYSVEISQFFQLGFRTLPARVPQCPYGLGLIFRTVTQKRMSPSGWEIPGELEGEVGVGRVGFGEGSQLGFVL